MKHPVFLLLEPLLFLCTFRAFLMLIIYLYHLQLLVQINNNTWDYFTSGALQSHGSLQT